MTKNKAQLRLNFTLQYKVPDIIKAVENPEPWSVRIFLSDLSEQIGRLYSCTEDHRIVSREAYLQPYYPPESGDTGSNPVRIAIYSYIRSSYKPMLFFNIYYFEALFISFSISTK